MFHLLRFRGALLRPAAFLTLMVALAGCEGRIEGFEFVDRRDGESRALELRDPARLAPEDETLVAGEPREVEFEEPLTLESGEAGFYIRYQGGSQARVRLVYADRGEEILTLPELTGITVPRRFYAPLPAGRLLSLSLEPASQPLEIQELGLSPYTPGITVGPDGVQLSAGYDLRRLSSNLFLTAPAPGEAMSVVEFRLDQAWEVEEPDSRPIAEIALLGELPEGVGSNGSGAVVSEAGSGDLGGLATHRLELLPGSRSYHLHLNEWAGEVVVGVASGSRTALESFSVRPLSREEPVPADMAQILTYPKERWRRQGYELFRWSAYPEILVFDTESYAFQARMFRRLAFFVEKEGFRGTLLSNADLANRHGWNAHNYRPPGLADFYNAVEERSFTLNEEEILLREIVLREGVLLRNEETGRYEPGVGGVLSVSQESWSLLRELLITHEALHGIYYEEPEFRSFVEGIWEEEFTPQEREFWRFFLSYMTYDPDDLYLMQNEMQAYLLQFPLQEIPGYFNGRIASRLRSGVPNRVDYIDQYFAAYGGSFGRHAENLNEFLFQLTGFSGGDVLAFHGDGTPR
ncbi:MAG: hypothetical protein ACOC45_06035 [Alkalispirochaetaceae bacterium]